MSWVQTRALREQKATAWESMKKVVDLADSESRAMTAEEMQEYDKHEVDIEAANESLLRFENAEKRSAALDTAEEELRRGIKPEGGADGTGDLVTGKDAERELRELRAFREFLTTGRTGSLSDVRSEGMTDEQRAHQADNDIEGGYLIAPQVMAAGLIKAVDDATFIRGLATVETLRSAASLGAVTLDTDVNDADWTQEITPVSEDNALRVGKRELKPQYLTKLIKLSRPLVRRTSGAAEDLIRNRMAYKFGITEEKAYLTGSGSNQPLGVFTADADGISTSRDVNTANTTTAFTADGLIEAKYNLKGQYWSRANWVFHRDGVKMARKLKDGNGQYIWVPGIKSDATDTLLEVLVRASEYAPNTFTSGLYAGIIGDFSNYWILDVFGLEVQVLMELYALTNQIGYIGRRELDGMPVLEEAFTRVTLA